MTLLEAFDLEMAVRFTKAAAHFLWQGTLIAFVAFALEKLFERRSARLAYAINLTALCLLTICLPVNWMLLAPERSGSEFVTTTAVSETPVVFVSEVNAVPVEFVQTTSSEIVASPPPVAADSEFPWENYTPILMFGYVAGVLVFMLRLFLGIFGGRRLRKSSRPIEDRAILEAIVRAVSTLKMSGRPAIAYCDRVICPAVVGIVKPVILIPLSMAAHLSPSQLEAVILHELAHLKRYDHLVLLLQRLIEALLFFHPATWWLSHRVSKVRELCCDDLVLKCGTEPADYAETLVRLSQSRNAGTSLTPEAAMTLSADGGNRSQLSHRVLRILGSQNSIPLKLNGAGFFGVLIALGVAVLLPLAVAQERVTEELEDSEAKLISQIAGKWMFGYPSEAGTIQGIMEFEFQDGNRMTAIINGEGRSETSYVIEDGRIHIQPDGQEKPGLLWLEADHLNLSSGLGEATYHLYRLEDEADFQELDITVPEHEVKIRLEGTKGLSFEGSIMSDGELQEVSGQVPAEFTVSGRSIECSFHKMEPEGRLALDLVFENRDGGSSVQGTFTDRPTGGVRGTIHSVDLRLSSFFSRLESQSTVTIFEIEDGNTTPPDPDEMREFKGLEIRLVRQIEEADTEPMKITQQVKGEPVEQTLHVQKTVLLDHTSVRSAALTRDFLGNHQIEIALSEEGSALFADITRQYMNEQLGIVIDGKLLSAPVVRGEITAGNVAISGNFSEQEATELVRKINASINSKQGSVLKKTEFRQNANQEQRETLQPISIRLVEARRNADGRIVSSLAITNNSTDRIVLSKRAIIRSEEGADDSNVNIDEYRIAGGLLTLSLKKKEIPEARDFDTNFYFAQGFSATLEEDDGTSEIELAPGEGDVFLITPIKINRPFKYEFASLAKKSGIIGPNSLERGKVHTSPLIDVELPKADLRFLKMLGRKLDVGVKLKTYRLLLVWPALLLGD